MEYLFYNISPHYQKNPTKSVSAKKAQHISVTIQLFFSKKNQEEHLQLQHTKTVILSYLILTFHTAFFFFFCCFHSFLKSLNHYEFNYET